MAEYTQSDNLYSSFESLLKKTKENLCAANREAAAAIDIIVQMAVGELPAHSAKSEENKDNFDRHREIFELRKTRGKLQRSY
ncbi:MAG: hypothetical protein AB1668_05015 [Nanoarchaeota archaeon]